MKKYVVVVSAVVAMIVVCSLDASAAPPSEGGASILQMLIDVFTRIADLVPPFVRPIFDFIIGILTSVLGAGG